MEVGGEGGESLAESCQGSGVTLTLTRQVRGPQPQDQNRKQCQRARSDPEEHEEVFTEQLRRDYSLFFFPSPAAEQCNEQSLDLIPSWPLRSLVWGQPAWRGRLPASHPILPLSFCPSCLVQLLSDSVYWSEEAPAIHVHPHKMSYALSLSSLQ